MATVCIALGALTRHGLTPMIGSTALPFIFFFPAVAAASWFGGLGPGLLSIGLSAFLAHQFFMGASFTTPTVNLSRPAALGAFIAASMIIVGAMQMMHRAGRRLSREIGERRRAEATLAEARDLFATTLASIGDAVIATDEQGRVTFMNREAERLTGWESAQAVGRALPDAFRIINEHTRQPVENPVEKVIALGKVVGLANHTVLIGRDGSEWPIDDSAAPIRNHEGRLIGTVLVFRDISVRKKAHEAQARLSAIVESSDDAIVSKTLDGIVLTWNRGAERLFGYSEAEMAGRPINLIIPPELQEEERYILERLRRGEQIAHFETQRIRRDGRRLYISLTISPIRDARGKVIGASKVARDVSHRRQVEDSLRQSEARFRAVVEGQAEMVCRFRRDGTILFANTAYARSVGSTAEALTGTSFWPFIPEADRTGVQAMLDGLTPDAPEIRIENRFDSTRGTRWTLWTNRALAFDEKGRWAEAQSMGLDISDRKRAEETVQALLRISGRLNSTLDVEELLGILVQEAAGLVGAESGVSGLRAAEGMTCDRYFQKGNWVPLRYCWPPMHGLPGWVLTHKTPYITNDAMSDGQILHELCAQFGVWSAASVPINTAQGEAIGFFEVHNKKDGSGFTPHDQEMLVAVSQAAATAIQNAVAYRSIQRAEETLKEADRRKDHFLAVLSHELRNPLTPIRMAATLLRRVEFADPQIKGVGELIDRQAGHLAHLLDDLLDVSRIATGRILLRIERIELGLAIASAVESARPLMDSLGHQLTVRVPPEPIHVDGDLTRLAQAFANLLNNAAKYTERGGHIRLSAERIGDEAVVRVFDTGIGIPPDQLGQVFEMFVQVDRSAERSGSGLGIGLSLVKKLVELHGGRIEAHSDGLGQGSEFTVRLPAVVSHAPHGDALAPAAGGGDSQQPRLRILVADDNRDSADILSRVLRGCGHDVRTAHDGLMALEVSSSFQPALAILDIGMPKLDGYEVARRIRSELRDRIMLIAMTGWGQDEDKQRAVEAGFDHHLTKPIDIADLDKLVSCYLQRDPPVG